MRNVIVVFLFPLDNYSFINYIFSGILGALHSIATYVIAAFAARRLIYPGSILGLQGSFWPMILRVRNRVNYMVV